jgi:hypothetical protein
MLNATILLTPFVTHVAHALREKFDMLISITLWVSLFLCLLNIALAIVFRKKQTWELVSYGLACIIELAIFVFALLLHLSLITKVPYNLPPGLPFDRAQIGAALTIAAGLFPAAYWHRINVSDLPKRIADDAKVIKDRDGGVRVRSDAPGEWMN